MRVVLPAPFGPRRPMLLPESVQVRFCRISRRPNRTDIPCSSTTGADAFAIEGASTSAETAVAASEFIVTVHYHRCAARCWSQEIVTIMRSEEHTSELQSPVHLV